MLMAEKHEDEDDLGHNLDDMPGTKLGNCAPRYVMHLSTLLTEARPFITLSWAVVPPCVVHRALPTPPYAVQCLVLCTALCRHRHRH